MSTYKCPECGFEFGWTAYPKEVVCVCGCNLNDYARRTGRAYFPLRFTNEDREKENGKILDRLKREGKLR